MWSVADCLYIGRSVARLGDFGETGRETGWRLMLNPCLLCFAREKNAKSLLGHIRTKSRRLACIFINRFFVSLFRHVLVYKLHWCANEYFWWQHLHFAFYSRPVEPSIISTWCILSSAELNHLFKISNADGFFEEHKRMAWRNKEFDQKNQEWPIITKLFSYLTPPNL